jgi:VanZ family protein
MSVIWWTSNFSPPPAPRRYDWRSVVQNFLHAPAFGLLALLLLLTLPRRGTWPVLHRPEQLVVVLGTLVYGVIDELHQASVPGRDLSVLDLMTDVTAAACVLWIVGYLGRTGATEAGLARRFALGLGACLLCALAATYVPWVFPDIGWF